MKILSRTKECFLALVVGSIVGLAFLFPQNYYSALFGWLASFGLVVLLQRKATLLAWFLAGCSANAIGFYWLRSTIQDFGGFEYFPAVLVHTLFIATASLQFVVAGILTRAFHKYSFTLAISSSLSWVITECIPIRIFPWQLGHTQLHFPAFAQVADIGGVTLISFLMLLSAERLYKAFQSSTRLQFVYQVLLATLLFIIPLSYGFFRLDNFEELDNFPKAKVGVIQANISVSDKHDIKSFEKNTDSYLKLSKQVSEPGMLVIWPETVIMDWVSVNVSHRYNDFRLPYLGNGSEFLVGSLAYDNRDKLHPKFYNAAFAVLKDGKVPKPYLKRALMPFGEYLPFVDYFPMLKELVPTAGEFSRGSDATVFQYSNSENPSSSILAAPLICYEDLVPEFSRQATLNGANVLVNITNDAWFGDTKAPYQHHMLAAFRAIENRRYLVRSTNSGLTAIVGPEGRTIASLEPFSEGILSADLSLIDEDSVYTKYFGEYIWRFLPLVVLVLWALKWVASIFITRTLG